MNDKTNKFAWCDQSMIDVPFEEICRVEEQYAYMDELEKIDLTLLNINLI